MGKVTRSRRRQGVTLDDIRAHLTAQRKDELVELLMSQAAVDERLREHLELEVASQRPDGLDLTAFRTAIDRAAAAGGDYVDYYAAHGYAHGIGEVVDRIAALLDQGYAEAVIELAEHAVKRVEEAIGWTDDSDGELGDLLEQLGGLHHQACLQDHPRPPEAGQAAVGAGAGHRVRHLPRCRSRSELVRVLLWEGDTQTAWREATEGGCSRELWLALAASREQDHPQDAVPIYRDQVDRTLQSTGNAAYEAAVDLLGRIRDLMARLGRQAEFADYLAWLRTAHKRKRNLIKLLDAQRW